MIEEINRYTCDCCGAVRIGPELPVGWEEHEGDLYCPKHSVVVDVKVENNLPIHKFADSNSEGEFAVCGYGDNCELRPSTDRWKDVTCRACLRKRTQKKRDS
jgi:hypothetical protein